MRFQKTQSGLTLIEMMIAMIVGLIIVGATLTFVFTIIKSTTENVRMTRMNQEMRVVASFIHDEVRRAGYNTDPDNPQMMELLDFNPDNQCLTYGYRSTSSTSANDNRMSFRLSEGQIIYSSPGQTPCEQGETISDVNTVNFTQFVVDDSETAGTATVNVPKLKITLTGQINNPFSERTITEIVRVRNEAPL